MIVNEQAVEADEAGSLRLTVNAVHIHFDDVLVTGLGQVNGEIVLGQSVAAIACNSRLETFTCTGDCNVDRAVTVEELVMAVNIALGLQPMRMCDRIDMDHSLSVTVDEILAAVDGILFGCSAG